MKKNVFILMFVMIAILGFMAIFNVQIRLNTWRAGDYAITNDTEGIIRVEYKRSLNKASRTLNPGQSINDGEGWVRIYFPNKKGSYIITYPFPRVTRVWTDGIREKDVVIRHDTPAYVAGMMAAFKEEGKKEANGRIHMAGSHEVVSDIDGGIEYVPGPYGEIDIVYEQASVVTDLEIYNDTQDAVDVEYEKATGPDNVPEQEIIKPKGIIVGGKGLMRIYVNERKNCYQIEYPFPRENKISQITLTHVMKAIKTREAEVMKLSETMEHRVVETFIDDIKIVYIEF